MSISRMFRAYDKKAPTVRGMLLYYDECCISDDFEVMVKFVPDDRDQKHRIFLMDVLPEPKVDEELNLEGDVFFVYGESPVENQRVDESQIIKTTIKCKIGVVK